MLGLLTAIPLRLWAGLALAIALGGGVLGYGHSRFLLGERRVTAAWDAEKLATAKATLKLVENRDRVQQDLQGKADNQRRAASVKLKALNSQLATALDGLRNRPERPSVGSVPEPASAGSGGCTGAQLFRPDSEFLVRLAADADRIAIALQSCQAAYGAARDALTPKP